MKSDLIKTEVMIVGAGVAGSSLAIRLANQGLDVVVVEKEKFPRHKLCGEFVSPECLSHFEKLDVLGAMQDIGGDAIHKTRFFSEKGRSVSVPSEWFYEGGSGALGISRAEMDFRLLEKARKSGASVIEEARVVSLEAREQRVSGVTVKSIQGERLQIEADLVVDATGRSRVLGKLIEKRSKIRKRKPGHIAFKAHFENVRLEKGVCEIYFFRGGYGGLNYIENGAANHCFLIDSKVAREFGGDADRIMQEVIFKNERVSHALKDSVRKFDWLAVSVDKFGRQTANNIENLVSIGDAGAFIDPFTGSGMLMALESSGILAAAVLGSSLARPHEVKVRFEAAHRRATRRRLGICSVMRNVAYSPKLAGFVIALTGLSKSFLKRIASLTRPAESV